MKRPNLYILLLFFLLLLPFGQTTANGNDSIRLSLLTCAPGEEIYSLFGHTAIRYEDPANGIDAVFNYGLFSFNTPNFYSFSRQRQTISSEPPITPTLPPNMLLTGAVSGNKHST